MDVAGADGLVGAVLCALFARRDAGCAMRSRRESAVVKSMIKRRVIKRFGQIRVFPRVSGFAVALSIAKPNMPLADHAGSIAVVFQECSDGWPIRFDHGISLRAKEHPVFQSVSPRIASRHQSVPSSAATRCGCVRIGKSNARSRQSVHVWRENLHRVAVACDVLVRTRVSHAHVIGHHQDDVRKFV